LTPTRTCVVMLASRVLRVGATVDGLRLDLHQDPRVDEIHLHDRGGRAEVAEDVTVHHRHAVDVLDVADVDARHDHVAQRRSEVLERAFDDLERSAHLVDHVIRHDLTVLVETGGARDADDAPVAYGARVPELELVLRRRRVEVAARIVRILEWHQPFILRMTASANSRVPTAVGSSRSGLRSYVTSLPSATTAAMARSSRSAASRSEMCFSMRTPASMSAIGFTLFWPAYLGAEPWMASKTATPFSPMFAPGATPSPPARPATRSLTMSPYRFGSTSTS